MFDLLFNNMFDLATLDFFEFLSSNQTIMRPTKRDGGCGDWALYGSSFHAVTAAWATLGYYAQAEMLGYMAGGFNKFATFIYLIGGIGGLIMMAFGQPPKNWVWFMISPAIFHFLVATPQQVHGVAWMIGPYKQSQEEVWKLAEAGAVNTGFFRSRSRFDIKLGPHDPVEIAMPFVFFDGFVSDLVRNLAHWSGAVSMESAKSNNPEDSNVALEYPGTQDAGVRFGRDLINSSEDQCVQGDKRHYAAVSNLKWQLLHSSVGSELSSADAREAFARFMSGECGSLLSKSLDYASVAQAVHQGGAFLPSSVFKKRQQSNAQGNNYESVRIKLGAKSVPFPEALRNILSQESSTTSFLNTLADSMRNIAIKMRQKNMIRCDQYFYMMILYFRYEASQIYINNFQNASPAGWEARDTVYPVLYGWDIPYSQGEYCSGNGFGTFQQEQFVYNLALAHLFRNEIRRVPDLITINKGAATEVVKTGETHNATVGSASKFAEVYVWSQMIPYIQGILLYLLTLAYPIVCMLLVIPQFQKTIITWMSFFVWVKLWDVGFAIVANIDKTLWAMMANTQTGRPAKEKLLEMAKYGGMDWSCTQWSGDANTGACLAPEIKITEGISSICDRGGGQKLDVLSSGINIGAGPGPQYPATAFDANIRIFDLSYIAGSALHFDIANGYYIYILAALYFAVPAVTGQLVLGAKAGAASFVDKMAGDPAGKAGGAAGSAFTANEVNKFKQAGGVTDQEYQASDLRKSGLAAKAIEQQNNSATYAMKAAMDGQASEGYGRLINANGLNMQAFENRLGPMTQAMKHFLAAKDKDPAIPSGGGSTSGNTIAPQGPQGDGAMGEKNRKSKAGGDTSDSPAIDSGRGAGGLTSDGNGNAISTGGGGHFDNLSKGQGRDVEGAQGKLSTVAGPAGGMMANFLGSMGDNAKKFDAGGAIDLTAGFGKAEFVAQTQALNNHLTALQGRSGISGFANNQFSTMARSGSERTMNQANASIADNNFRRMSAYAQSKSNYLAAVGASPGMLAPERMSNDITGFAMRGMLDVKGQASTQSMANYFDFGSGKMFGEVNNAKGRLDNNFGYHAVQGAFKDLGFGGTMVAAGQYAAKASKEAFSGNTAPADYGYESKQPGIAGAPAPAPKKNPW